MSSNSKIRVSESELQRACARYLKLRSVPFFHTPNGMYSNWRSVKFMKASGMQPGVPDLLVIRPCSGFNGLAIELKVGYNRPSDLQRKWFKIFVDCGWAVAWVNSFDSFEFLVRSYLGGDFIGIDNSGFVNPKDFYKFAV